MRIIGKACQVVALALLPVGIVMQLSGSLGRPFGVADLLVMLVFGVALFYVGRMVEGYAGA